MKPEQFKDFNGELRALLNKYDIEFASLFAKTEMGFANVIICPQGTIVPKIFDEVRQDFVNRSKDKVYHITKPWGKD